VSQEGWLIEAPRRTWPLERTPEPGDCVVLPSDPAEDTATGAYVFDGAREDVIVVATPALPGSACERVGAAR
jgi:hypothetical protein